jgi:sugar phosphate isomerase/epimerase
VGFRGEVYPTKIEHSFIEPPKKKKGSTMDSNNEKQTRRGFLGAVGIASASAVAACGTWNGGSTRADASETASKDTLPLSLGLASYTTRKFTLEQTVEIAKRVGLQHICLKSFHLELDATDEEIAAAVKTVRDAGLDLYGGGVITMKNEDAVQQAFAYAKAAGMRTIVGAPVPEVLPLVNEKVKQLNIAVAIHNHGPGDKVYPTPESIYEKVKGLDARIGICMDVGHTVRIGADPVVDAERFADRLLDVHLKDVSAASAEGKCVEAGRGVIDLPAFLRKLVKIKYSGIASFEYEKDQDDPLPGLAESVGYIRGILATL